ncbi:TPA: helix-turn-helix transcriptional regulator [Escherichia coli]|nr:helix-turn-helix transcriptional regulator [Escherichia coli]
MSGLTNCIPLYLGMWIKSLRKQRGLSGKQLAVMINISQQQISRYERGVSDIRPDMLVHLLFILKINLRDIENSHKSI